MSLVLRKFGFGSDYKTDFFYFSKSSDDWNAVFIEIEKPSCKFFKSKSNSFTAEFNNALEQINNWRAWLLDEKNKATFRSNVSAIQMPSHIAHNPIYNKFVLVFGRRSEYENNNVRRRRVAALEREDFKSSLSTALLKDWRASMS